MTLKATLIISILIFSVSFPFYTYNYYNKKSYNKIETAINSEIFNIGDIVYFKNCPEWGKFMVRRVTTESVFLYSPTYLNGEFVNKSLLTHTNDTFRLQ